MGKPATLLEGLCGHALSFNAQSVRVEYKDHREWVFANIDGESIGIANYASSSTDAKELRGNLAAAAKKPLRTHSSTGAARALAGVGIDVQRSIWNRWCFG